MVILAKNPLMQFQFTHPGRGATHFGDEYANPHQCFNSRTPGGVRLKAYKDSVLKRVRFNSRTPGGVRQSIQTFTSVMTMFQFTHPGRGATYR